MKTSATAVHAIRHRWLRTGSDSGLASKAAASTQLNRKHSSILYPLGEDQFAYRDH